MNQTSLRMAADYIGLDSERQTQGVIMVFATRVLTRVVLTSQLLVG
jgi:hypothetical protein